MQLAGQPQALRKVQLAGLASRGEVQQVLDQGIVPQFQWRLTST